MWEKTQLIQQPLPQPQVKQSQQKTDVTKKDNEQLIKLIKFKQSRNASHFVATKDIKIEAQNIMLYEGASLYFSNVSLDDDDITFSILYESNAKQEAVEGLVVISIQDICNLLINKTLIACYNYNNKIDNEITNAINGG